MYPTSHPSDHGHHHHAPDHIAQPQSENIFKLALSATLHCLLGCGLGEVLGMVIGTFLGLSMIMTMALAITLGFVFGLAFGMLPLVRKGFTPKKALSLVIVGEGLSIAVMEAFEVYTQVNIPGVMEAGLTDSLFWLGMSAGLAAGFIAAFPVNYVMIKKGFRHQH